MEIRLGDRCALDDFDAPPRRDDGPESLIAPRRTESETALQDIVGVGNVTVTGEAVPNTFTITSEGIFAGDSIFRLITSYNLTGGTNPSSSLLSTPVEITSTPNTTLALDRDDPQPRVIIDGSQTGRGYP